MELRHAVASEIRDVDPVKREVLMTFPHEKVDTYSTTFAPDAFRESFERSKPTVCWQHDSKEPIGKVIDAQITPRANDLVARLSDFDAVPLARRAFSQIEDGSLTGVSFGFERQADEKHPEHRGVKRITKAVMREVSPVTFPSIPGAIFTGVRQEVPAVEVRNIIELVEHKVVSPEQAQAMLREAGVAVPDLRAGPNAEFARDPARESGPKGSGAVGAADVRPGMVVVGPNDSPALVNAVHMPNPEVVVIHYQGQQDSVTYHPRTQLQHLDPANPLVPGPEGLSATAAAKYTMGNSDRSAEAPEHRDDGDAGELAAAVDAALDEAVRQFDAGNDEQAKALVQAAGAAVDDLLEVMGVPDVDETGADEGAPAMAPRSDDPELQKRLDEAVTAYNAEKRRAIPQAERDKMPSGNFAGKGDSFPINKPEDVEAAFHRLGSAGPDNLHPDEIKANIVRIAKKLGPEFVAKLPDSVKQEDAKREARARAAMKSLERRAS